MPAGVAACPPTGLALQLLQVACTCNRVHNSCRLVGGLVGDRPGPDRPRSGCLFVPPPEVQASRLKGKTIGEVFGRGNRKSCLVQDSLFGEQATRKGRPFILVCERAPPKTWERQREKTERLGEKNKDKTTAIIVLRYQRAQAHKAHKAQETRVLCYIVVDPPSPIVASLG